MKKLFRKRNLLRLLEYSMITAGAIIAAFAIEEFLVPNTILDGGIVGISIIINNLTKIRLGLLTFVLNLPFLLIGMKKMGRGFILRSAYAMVVF
ncbi:MAG: YitT family protein, partial [Clostridia bacterium]|nr:YitT family protein [Clostridia bacterium]